MLIGLHGKARSGKDTVAAHLIKKHNLFRYGPSVPVKDITAAMFNFPRWYLDDDKMKEEIDPFWHITYRQMAQKVGKECSRDIFGEDFWMRHVEKKFEEVKETCGIITQTNILPEGMILADIRYPNEAEWVRARGGIVLFIVRDNAPTISGFANHEGEKGLSVDLADAVIYNNGTIEELYQQVDRILAY
jgi:hypothetical protein